MGEAEREYERQEFAGVEGYRPGPHRGVEAYTVIAIIAAAVLSAIAFETIEHWAQWVVLGAIVATVIGFMIAVSPARRG
jgi:hypothetical protein